MPPGALPAWRPCRPPAGVPPAGGQFALALLLDDASLLQVIAKGVMPVPLGLAFGQQRKQPTGRLPDITSRPKSLASSRLRRLSLTDRRAYARQRRQNACQRRLLRPSAALERLFLQKCPDVLLAQVPAGKAIRPRGGQSDKLLE